MTRLKVKCSQMEMSQRIWAEKANIAFVKFTISLFLEMQAGTVKAITKEIYRLCESECVSQ